MTKEQSTLIVDLIDIAKRAGYTITITKNGQVIREVHPSQPFAVKDDEVHMEPAKVDYEAIGRDVVKLIGFNVFDPRKHLGDTFDESVKSWRDDIANVTEPSSDIVISIGTLNVNVG